MVRECVGKTFLFLFLTIYFWDMLLLDHHLYLGRIKALDDKGLFGGSDS